MTAIATSKLQQSVYALLAADAALGARVTAVYDEPPVGATMPYVALGETQTTPGNVKDRLSGNIRFDVLVWSSETSQMEAKELMALVERVLAYASPDVPGFEITEIRPQGSNVVRQFSEGGSLYRGRLSYSARVFEEV